MEGKGAKIFPFGKEIYQSKKGSLGRVVIVFRGRKNSSCWGGKGRGCPDVKRGPSKEVGQTKGTNENR